MLRFLFYVTFVFAVFDQGVMADIPENMIWRGQLEVNNQILRLEISIAHQDGAWSGDFFIMGKGGTSLSQVTLDENLFQFAIAKIGVTYRGVLNKNGTLATGEFHQNGQSMPLELTTFSGIEGTVREIWEGVLTVDQLKLPMVLKIAEGQSGNKIAYFQDVSKNQTYHANWVLDHEVATLEVPFIGLKFQGDIYEKTNEIKGTWLQPDRELEFVLKKQIIESPPLNVPVPTKAKSAKQKSKESSEAIPAEAWERLAADVQAMVDGKEIVGGELLVIQGRKPVFQKAFGWKDRERGVVMPVDAIYCVRSMTKPLIGSAIQMLLDEGKLTLDAPIHEMLPAFDTADKKSITVRHLLEHSSGLPFIPVKKPVTEYANVREVVADIATMKLSFEPGADFLYSDSGSITLGAIISVISGMSAEAFIQKRILDPLGMKDSHPLIGNNEAVLKRIPSAYSGGMGAWFKHWQPSDAPIFPIFLGSASLYSTTTDYAKFLSLWMDEGRLGEERLLSVKGVRDGLTSKRLVKGYPVNFDGLKAYYGHQWLVYTEKLGKIPSGQEIFGHDGADGTFAWAWPEKDLMVLFFTQSRGTHAGVTLQNSIQKLLLDKDLEPAAKTAGLLQNGSDDIAGLYWDETARNAYYVIKPLGDRLTLTRPGKMHETFKPGAIPDRFEHMVSKQAWIEFSRNAQGEVVAMKTSFGGRMEHNLRHVPDEDLPSVSEVVAKVGKAHQIERLAELGVIKMKGRMTFEATGLVGMFESFFDKDREKVSVRFGSTREVVIKHREQAWSRTTGKAPEALEGVRLEQALNQRMMVIFGVWTDYYPQVEVLKRLNLRDRSFLLVRVVSKEGQSATMYVDETSGMVMAKDAMVHIPGFGTVGVHMRFKDFRDVGGMQLPFATTSKFASNLIGVVETKVRDVALDIKTTDKLFLPPKKFRNKQNPSPPK